MLDAAAVRKLISEWQKVLGRMPSGTLVCEKCQLLYPADVERRYCYCDWESTDF